MAFDLGDAAPPLSHSRVREAKRAVDLPHPVIVAHVVLSLNVGGLEQVVLRLLAHTDRELYAPFVCALDEPGVLAPELARLGVPLYSMRRRSGLDPWMPLRLMRLFQREGVHVVHTHNATPHLYGALAAHLCVGRRPRVVHTKHGRNQPELPRKVWVNRLAASITDRVVAVSDDAANVVTTIERVRPGKVMTIVNGVDTSDFRPGRDRRAARASLGVPHAGFHVGCIARLAEVKDHATLLAAFARVVAARPDAHLTLIGDGDERQRLVALASTLGLDHAVTFAGERSDVAALLPAFDVFALSSRSEGISLTLLEAASAGLPIVATDVGGNREVVTDGHTGLLVPSADPARFADALLAMAERPDRAAVGAAGRERVEQRFSVERMARAYQDIYATLLAPSPQEM